MPAFAAISPTAICEALYRILLLFLIFFSLSAFSQELVVQLGHTSPVVYLEVSADGKQILSGTREGVVKLWDFHLGRLVRTYTKKVRGDEAAFAFFKETASGLKMRRCFQSRTI